MSELLTLVSELRRPRLLIRAARAGLGEYNRCRDLKRLMRVGDTPAPARALTALMAQEALVEQTRCAGEATYSFSHHIQPLIAMMAEVRLLPRPEQTGT